MTPLTVVDSSANNDRKIAAMLRSHRIGPLEVKTRHVAADANRLQKKFQSDGPEPGVLLIARIAGKTRAVLATRPDPVGGPV